MRKVKENIEALQSAVKMAEQEMDYADSWFTPKHLEKDEDYLDWADTQLDLIGKVGVKTLFRKIWKNNFSFAQKNPAESQGFLSIHFNVISKVVGRQFLPLHLFLCLWEQSYLQQWLLKATTHLLLDI